MRFNAKVVLVLVAVISLEWIEAAPTDSDDSFNLDPYIEENPRCRINEYWEEYASYCTPTCQQPRIRICTSEVVSRCLCKKGYIWSNSTLECIKIEDCPPINPVNPEKEKDYDKDLFSNIGH